MKRLFLILFAALITSQMWGATYKANVYYCDGCSSSMGTIWVDNDASSTSGKAEASYGTYTTFKFHAKAVPGYKFVGWRTSAKATTNASTDNPYSYSGSSSVTRVFYAYFAADVQDVTVSVALANGMTAGMGSASGGKTIAAGKDVTITASAKGDYYFVGWSLNASGTPIENTTAERTVQASNTTYYAVFAQYKTSTITPASATNQNWSSVSIPTGFVDLGLPSGKLWAENNLGAEYCYSTGNLYAWGSTTARRYTDYDDFSYSNYGASSQNLVTDYAGNATYDPATANNADTYTPSYNDFKELKDNCTIQYVTTYGSYTKGIDGFKVIGPNGNTIFLPKNCVGDGVNKLNTAMCNLWTSTYKGGSGATKEAYYFAWHESTYKYQGLISQSTTTYIGYAHHGMGVRPVRNGISGVYTLTIVAKCGENTLSTSTFKCNQGEHVKITPNENDTYTFDKWNDNNSTTAAREFIVNQNATYTVIYKQAVTNVAVNVALANGMTADMGSVSGGNASIAQGSDMNITATANTGYYFVGWSNNQNGSNIIANSAVSPFGIKASATTYYAVFAKYLTATFYNYDNSLYQTNSQVKSGTIPSYTGTPTKPQDNTYTYKFTGWSPTLAAITSDQTYTAQFNPEYRNYSVTFRTSAEDSNPNVKNDYHYNDIIANKPAFDPMKVTLEDEEADVEFRGWYLLGTETAYTSGMKVTDNMIFQAKFDTIAHIYDTITVNVLAGQGKVVLNYGKTACTLNTNASMSMQERIRRYTTVTAVATAARGYHVVVDSTYAAAQRTRLNKNLTWNFKFEANTPVDLIENHATTVYNDSLADAYAGKELTVTIKQDANTYRVIANGNWATICLPFDYDVTSADIIYDQIYTLTKASVDNSNIATMEFVRQTHLTAYTPYLITARQQMDKLVFDGVQLKAAPTTPEELQITQGNVDFIGAVNPCRLLNSDGLKKFYITGKSLKFAGTTGKGALMYGYRAYFEKNGEEPTSAPARRAIVRLGDEEIIEAIITEDGELVPVTRKYIENGTMIIERDGVRYTADGVMVE